MAFRVLEVGECGQNICCQRLDLICRQDDAQRILQEGDYLVDHDLDRLTASANGVVFEFVESQIVATVIVDPSS